LPLHHVGPVHAGCLNTDQHFAIALDGRLVTVPSIDFRAYPDGIQSGNRADISGGFTARGARDLAALLRFGPLAVRLVAR